jgi:hypothetical protein
VQRREGGCRLQPREYVCIDPHRCEQVDAAMHDAVADRIGLAAADVREHARIDIGMFDLARGQFDHRIADRIKAVFDRGRAAVEREDALAAHRAHCQSRTSGRSSPCSAM